MNNLNEWEGVLPLKKDIEPLDLIPLDKPLERMKDLEDEGTLKDWKEANLSVFDKFSLFKERPSRSCSINTKSKQTQ